MSRQHEKRSYEYCPETCPAVSEVASEFESLVERIKEVSSYKLREALVAACRDLSEAESEVEDLKQQVAQCNYEIADLRSQLREMEAEASA